MVLSVDDDVVLTPQCSGKGSFKPERVDCRHPPLST